MAKAGFRSLINVQKLVQIVAKRPRMPDKAFEGINVDESEDGDDDRFGIFLIINTESDTPTSRILKFSSATDNVLVSLVLAAFKSEVLGTLDGNKKTTNSYASPKLGMACLMCVRRVLTKSEGGTLMRRFCEGSRNVIVVRDLGSVIVISSF